MSELNPEEIVDIITLDRIAKVLQLRNTADPDAARAEVIGDLHRIRNMLAHETDMTRVDGPDARAVVSRAVRLLADLGALEMTSLGTATVRHIRSRATAGRVADILNRHAAAEKRLAQDSASVQPNSARPGFAESAAAHAVAETPEEPWTMKTGAAIIHPTTWSVGIAVSGVVFAVHPHHGMVDSHHHDGMADAPAMYDHPTQAMSDGAMPDEATPTMHDPGTSGMWF